MHRQGYVWLCLLLTMSIMFMILPRLVVQNDSIFHLYGDLVEVDAVVRKHYVKPIDSKSLADGAIRGLLDSLDPYSTYISPQQRESFERRKSGRFIGIGVELGTIDGSPTVIAPIEGGPAARAGIRPGDAVLAVDGIDARKMPMASLRQHFSGRLNTSLELTVQHEGETESTKITVNRGPVALASVRGFARDDQGEWDYIIDRESRIGYIRVSSFAENTMSDFDVALGKLLSQNVSGLIIDLRFNPGGLMFQAIEMADRFLNEGTIVATVTRRQATIQYTASSTGTITHLPIAVLINDGSASSSEIVSGALQDHSRATIVGQRSFGKGTVQHLIPLANSEAAIKLTVARYRLPGGTFIHRDDNSSPEDPWGITPDLVIPLERAEEVQILAARAQLDSYDAASTSKQAAAGSPRHVLIDRQTSAAIDHLKAVLLDQDRS